MGVNMAVNIIEDMIVGCFMIYDKMFDYIGITMDISLSVNNGI